MEQGRANRQECRGYFRRPKKHDINIKITIYVAVDAVRSKWVSGGALPVIAKITGDFEITGKAGLKTGLFYINS